MNSVVLVIQLLHEMIFFYPWELSLLQLQQELICVYSPPLLTLRKQNKTNTFLI